MQIKREIIRNIKILIELIQGYRALKDVGPCVTVFGSARIPEKSPYYTLARDVGAELAKAGFNVMTGGGPGLMEAANRGAKDVAPNAKGKSIGCNIKLPFEQEPNPYLDLWMEFKYFFVRKFMLVKYSYAFVALPGGFGTMDELFEVATLVQTGKMTNFPIILMGEDYWRPLMGFLRDSMLSHGAIEASDLDEFKICDSPKEVAALIRARWPLLESK